ncbi:MAG: APC family permease [Solirubrobacterales bacterium]|nr:APC family permease [Solirubrobacterales bacterium]
MANIGPAMSFFFGFGTVVAAAGVAAPLTIIAAAIAIALLGNTLTQFSKSSPSAGSFVTFIGRTFGPWSAIVAAIVLISGYIIAVAAVVAISGGWAHTILEKYLSISIPWQLLTFVFSAGALYLVISGVKPTTTVAGVFFVFEMALLAVVAVALLIEHGGSLNLHPLDPSRLHNGFSGLSLGFPLAVYLFVGWENSAPLAEESTDPRSNVGRAVFSSIALMAVTYIVLSYVTVIAFHDNVSSIAASSVPYVDAAQSVAGALAFFAYLAGLTSIIGSLLAATNSQSRILFSSAREGLLPDAVASVTKRSHTPWASLVAYLVLALGLTYIFGWNTDPVKFFGEIATLGTILIALTYLAANLALPFYYRRFHRDRFSLVRHLLLPALGAFAIGYPLYELIKPGQPAPFSRYPFIALAILVVAAGYAAYLNHHDRTLGQRIGSVVADAE